MAPELFADILSSRPSTSDTAMSLLPRCLQSHLHYLTRLHRVAELEVYNADFSILCIYLRSGRTRSSTKRSRLSFLMVVPPFFMSTNPSVGYMRLPAYLSTWLRDSKCKPTRMRIPRCHRFVLLKNLMTSTMFREGEDATPFSLVNTSISIRPYGWHICVSMTNGGSDSTGYLRHCHDHMYPANPYLK